MDDESARSALWESLTRPTGLPSAWCDDPDAYIKRCKAELLASLIDPRPVEAATTVDGESPGAGSRPRPQTFVAIAKRDDTWLLFDPGTRRFFRACGSNPDERRLRVLEFGSEDALLEWLG